ncbi:Pectin acetylesterase 7 [Abeliophyllum distichum]|uniref:Pectin acetylesterase n=1 Tax=Abeliophyllum distichum TaxID=126358 RepID=A0ABD1TX91_9LAMI
MQNGISRSGYWIIMSLLIFLLIVIKTEGLRSISEVPNPINITFIDSAVSKGAVCLDGSPPAYHFDKGFGDGIDNWLVYLEGGGWCETESKCKARAHSIYGSSFRKPKIFYFDGILSKTHMNNPDFYNWNRVFVRYCDGSSFTGNVKEVNPATNLYYRGARIFKVVVEDLLDKGMKYASNAILTGCSAGGLATILNCDGFRALVPSASRVKCISDSGYFIHA